MCQFEAKLRQPTLDESVLMASRHEGNQPCKDEAIVELPRGPENNESQSVTINALGGGGGRPGNITTGKTGIAPMTAGSPAKGHGVMTELMASSPPTLLDRLLSSWPLFLSLLPLLQLLLAPVLRLSSENLSNRGDVGQYGHRDVLKAEPLSLLCNFLSTSRCSPQPTAALPPPTLP
jgi:hypothetical protein